MTGEGSNVLRIHREPWTEQELRDGHLTRAIQAKGAEALLDEARAAYVTGGVDLEQFEAYVGDIQRLRPDELDGDV